MFKPLRLPCLCFASPQHQTHACLVSPRVSGRAMYEICLPPYYCTYPAADAIPGRQGPDRSRLPMAFSGKSFRGSLPRWCTTPVQNLYYCSAQAPDYAPLVYDDRSVPSVRSVSARARTVQALPAIWVVSWVRSQFFLFGQGRVSRVWRQDHEGRMHRPIDPSFPNPTVYSVMIAGDGDLGRKKRRERERNETEKVPKKLKIKGIYSMGYRLASSSHLFCRVFPSTAPRKVYKI
ncbi:hypothetical protein F5Y12DRAFT_740656 [Xylaria sp. FL1777]|nr:hypothetical protein F5Y12DRAFT_740656 [Xylaria sp. FL1777]